MAPSRKANIPRQGRLMSQTAAALALGMHRNAVLKRVAAGELAAEMVDGNTPVIVRASVEAYLRRQRAALAATA